MHLCNQRWIAKHQLIYDTYEMKMKYAIYHSQVWPIQT